MVDYRYFILRVTMSDRLEVFEQYRTRMNDRIASIDHLGIKRFSISIQLLPGRRTDSRTKNSWVNVHGPALQRLR